MIVAIDGPAAAGKSTTARRVARELGFLYLDTGAMYRAVTWAMLEASVDPAGEDAVPFVQSLKVDVAYEDDEMGVRVNGEDVTPHLRTSRVSGMTSRVSQLAVVREKLVDEQRRIARECEARDGGAVLDGRDIGTVVFPDAGVKIFLLASIEERARRRWKEMTRSGKKASLEAIQEELEARDRQDAERALAPLRKADDALVLDTSDLTIDGQVQFVIDRVRERQLA